MTQAAKSAGRGLSDPMYDLGHGLYAFTGDGAMATRLFVLTKDPNSTSAAPSFREFWQTGIGWCLFTPADLAKVDIAKFTALAREKLPPIEPRSGNANYFVWLQSKENFDDLMSVQWVLLGGRQGNGSSTSTFPCDRMTVALNAQNGSLTLLLQDGVDGGPPTVKMLTAPSNISFAVDGEKQVVGLPLSATQAGISVWTCQLALSGPQAGSLAMPLALDLGKLSDQFGLETTYQYLPSEIENDLDLKADLQSVRMPLFAPQTPAPTEQSAFCAFNILMNPFHPYVPEASGIRVDRAGRLLSGSQISDGTVQATQVANARALVSPFGAVSNGAVLTLTPADPVEEKLPFDAYIGGGFAYSPSTSGTRGAAPSTSVPMSPAGVFLPATSTAAEPRNTGSQAGDAPPGAQSVDIMPGLFALDFVRLAEGDRVQFEPQHPAYIPPAKTTARAAAQSDATTSYVSVFKGTAAAGRGYFGQSSTANLYMKSDNAPPGVLSAALAELSPLTKTPAFPMLFVGALFLEHPKSGPINPNLTRA